MLDPFRAGGLIFPCRVFFPFTPFMGFSWQVSWGGLQLPPPVHHALSELPTMIPLSWVVLHVMACSFTELHKPFATRRQGIHEGVSWVLHVTKLIFFLF